MSISAPKFTFIVPCYNVSRYLGEFTRSINELDYDPSGLELIFVNDGSTDDTSERLDECVQELKFPSRILTKENGGLSSARNYGLAEVNTPWVSFIDPDDLISSNYLTAVSEMISTNGVLIPDLICTNIIRMDDQTMELVDNHPLRWKFEEGNQIINLSRDPRYIQLSAATAFFKTNHILENGLVFDVEIRPNFEDAVFIAHYLDALSSDAPTVGLCANARYYYRQRMDGSSLVQSSWSSDVKYTLLMDRGYFQPLQEFKNRYAAIPVWFQNAVLYDLSFFFKADARIHSVTAAVQPETSAEFFSWLTKILDLIDSEVIETFAASSLDRTTWHALKLLKSPRTFPSKLNVWRIDQQQQLVLVKYFIATRDYDEQFYLDYDPIKPVFEKYRAVQYFGRTVMWERIVWLPAQGRLQVRINERLVPLEVGFPKDSVYSVDVNIARSSVRKSRVIPKAPGSSLAQQPKPLKPGYQGTLLSVRVKELRSSFRSVRRNAQQCRDSVIQMLRSGVSLVRQLARPKQRNPYRNAWLFIDRDTQAHDNAEHLYRYVQQQRPDINAWFLLRRDSPDWQRLSAEGFKMVAFGTDEHAKALRSCRELISSQVDPYVLNPPKPFSVQTGFRFTFLQHGVTKDDLSRWVNRKPVSLVLSVMQAEHESFVGDETPYLWTEREVERTGFPRHDALLAKVQARPEGDSIVLMPTWRRNLVGELVEGGNQRELLPGFWESDFISNWMGLMNSDKLKRLCEEQGLRIIFMPHPNLQIYMTKDRLPDFVEVLHYKDADIQEVIAGARVVVSDFSSLAFDAAIADRAVVHFQFDADKFFDGSHAYRKGYFDYHNQGFGPVCSTVDEVVEAIGSQLDSDSIMRKKYSVRADEAFAGVRDGQSCMRAVAAIEKRRGPFWTEL